MPFHGTPNLKGRPKGSGHRQTFSQVVRTYLEKPVEGKRPLDAIISKLTDEKPIVIRIEGVEMEFGKGKANGPIADYLRPDAEYIVTEDSLKRIPTEQKVQRAEAGWNTAKEAAQLGLTGGLIPALRELVEVLGFENAEEWLKQSQQPGQQGGQPGMMPGAQLSMDNQVAPG